MPQKHYCEDFMMLLKLEIDRFACGFLRRFSADFGRREYRKMNAISENKNKNVELIVNDVDDIRKEILAKFEIVGESNKFLTNSDF